jgi:hypothetical protein
MRGSAMCYRIDRVHQLLTNLCEDIERQIRPNLSGAMGNLVRGYLPQVWVFETECGTYTLFLDTEGNARVFPGADREVDVTIRWRKDALESMLASRNRDSVLPGDYPDVTVHTDKGRAAFNYLKREIGL